MDKKILQVYVAGTRTFLVKKSWTRKCLDKRVRTEIFTGKRSRDKNIFKGIKSLDKKVFRVKSHGQENV